MTNYQKVENILVGAARVYISKGDSQDTTNLEKSMPAFGTSKVEAYMDAAGATKWRDVGFTSEGLEVSYEPQYGEVEVDQLLDSARIFKTQLRVMLRTSMNEGTLENVAIAFGQAASSRKSTVQNASGANTAIVNNYSASGTVDQAPEALQIQGGNLGEAPVERSLVAVGSAPTTLSTTKAERVYLARRVLSMETVSHALRRNEASVYPVTFRCLPDPAFEDAEYGEILDRVYS
jgi:hypothetical protein